MQNILGLQFRWVFRALTLFHIFHDKEANKKRHYIPIGVEVIYLDSVNPGPERD